MHVAGAGEACHQRQRAEGVSHVVHVETVTGTLLIADSRQRAVKAVAQPVENKKEVYEPKSPRVPRGERIGCARQQLRNKAQGGQVVRRDGFRCPLGHPY